MITRRWMLVLAGCAALAGCGPSAGQGADRAAVVFADNCGVCHGPQGEGKAEIKAPSIAGLPVWYVQAQLGKFREGIRGAHADDVAGLRMRPMSRSLKPDDVDPVAAYVAALPPVAPDTTVIGNAEAGKALYATCAACHGPDGKGMEALKSPPIVQLDDWYLATQIHNFKVGIRGSNPKDVTGAQMRPMAATLKDDQAVADVVAHLRTLSGGL